MQAITNERIIQRNARLAKYLYPLGLVVLVSGLVTSFVRPDLVLVPYTTLIVGFLLSNFAVYMTNRYVARPDRPRPDKALCDSLKGLDDRYRLYSFHFPATYTLVCPSGVYALIPKFQGGYLTWDERRRRFKHKGGSFFRNVFGQESLGNPIAEASSEAQRLARFLDKELAEDVPPVKAIIVFTNPKLEMDGLNGVPVTTIKSKRLNAYLRKQSKGESLTEEQLTELEEKLKISVP